MKKIVNALFVGSIVVTYILLFIYAEHGNSLSVIWLAPLSPILSCIIYFFVDEIAVRYFGHEKNHNKANFSQMLTYTNFALTALMVIIMFFVNSNRLGGDFYLFKYMLPWIILLGESIVLAVLVYLSSDYKLKDVYNGECFVIDKVENELEISTNANDIITILEDIKSKAKRGKSLGYKLYNFDWLLDVVRCKKYYLTKEEYDIINEMLDNCVDILPLDMIKYLEIKSRLQEYKYEVNTKKKYCIKRHNDR